MSLRMIVHLGMSERESAYMAAMARLARAGRAYRDGTTLDPDDLHRARDIEADLLDANRRPDLDHDLAEQQAHLDRCVINRYDAAVLVLDLLPLILGEWCDALLDHAGEALHDIDAEVIASDLRGIAEDVAHAEEAIVGTDDTDPAF